MRVNCFEKGDPPLDLDTLAREIEVPVRFVNSITRELFDAKIISEVVSNGAESRYQPALDIHKINIQFVIDKLESRGLNNVCVTKSEDLDKINSSLMAIDREMIESKANKLLHKL